MTFDYTQTRHDTLRMVKRRHIAWRPPIWASRNGHGWTHITPGVPLASEVIQALDDAHNAGHVSAEGVGKKGRRTAYLTGTGLALLREWERGAA